MSDPYIDAVFPELNSGDPPPGCICCDCESDNVDLHNGEWTCRNCGAYGTIKIVVEKVGVNAPPSIDVGEAGDGSRWDEL
jgi:hypothetical protein